MKHNNRVPQLTLELYYRDLATYGERRQVKKALKTDSETRKRYEALQQSHREASQFVRQELSRKQIPATPPVPHTRRKKVVVGLLVAAVLLCAGIPAILYLTNNDSNKSAVIAEETAPPIEVIEDEPDNIVDIPGSHVAPPDEPPAATDKGNTNNKAANKPVIAETPPPEPEFTIDPQSGVSITEAPSPDTGVRFRGESQQGATAEPEPTPNINIPPGITFIFENMFADKGLTFVVIPSRITSIGKNAFSGNPLLSVTIGANVSIEDTAIPGNFATFYNANGKAAGTYIRPDVNSEAWEKK